MRKDVRSSQQTLIKALESLGYHRVSGTEWRHGNFHVTLTPRKTRVTIDLHADVPGIGSSHHGRKRGEDITEEFERIKQEYRGLRNSEVSRMAPCRHSVRCHLTVSSDCRTETTKEG